MIAAVARALRRAYDAVSRGISAFLVVFWRTAIILTAKFLSGASVSWVELADDSRRDDQIETVDSSGFGGASDSESSTVLEKITRLLLKAFGKKIPDERTFGRQQRIYFANHTSHLDSIVIWSVLPGFLRRETRMVAAKDYWTAGPFRRYLAKKVFNAILIDRKHISIKNNQVNQLLQEMGTDHSIIIFPEGGRGDGETIRPFKSGIYYLAKKNPELELVPIYLDNMNRILPRGVVLPVPMLSRVIFGSPIWIQKKETMEKTETTKSPIPGENISEKTEEEKWSYEERVESKDDFLRRCREAVLELKDL
ncbi:MAG: 1-acyl-sn-glycerol-3-phosphate acyltransferase [Thermoguttaceae bacterium]|nr:1-acyl-sn-glycerol-3-phosphate acyltransferase [Thermoguttaceae bacterium]